MPETNTTSIPPQPGEVLSYKPVSGWAVLSLMLGIAFALAVVFSFFYGLAVNNPLMLPLWTMSAAALGVAASLLALRQIAVSEGTRVGKEVAIWGLWLCVVSALGHSAFYGFTYLALIRQANDFVMVMDANDEQGSKPNSGFFPRLEKGASNPTQLNSAFLLTQHPDKRKKSDPHDDEDMRKSFDVSGLLTRFRELKLVKMVRGSKIQAENTVGEVTFEPLGVVDWDRPETGTYMVTRNYQIKTPELTAVVTLTVYSFDSPGEPRRWMANVIPNPGQNDPVKIVQWNKTPLGEAIRKIQEEAFNSMKDRTKKLLADPSSVPDNTPPGKIPKVIQEKVKAIFQQSGGGTSLNFEPLSAIPAKWMKVDNKLKLQYPVKVFIPPDNPQLELEGFVTLESLAPVDPNNFSNAQIDWKVISLEWERSAPSRGPN